MSRREWLVLAAALLLGLLLLGWGPMGAWLGWLERHERVVDRGPTLQARTTPLFAVEKLLRQRGRSTARFRSLDRLPEPPAVLLLPTDLVWIAPTQLDPLVSWVERGGELILVLPSEVDAQPGFERSSAHALIERFGLAVGEFEQSAGEDDAAAPRFTQGGAACPAPNTDPVLPPDHERLHLPERGISLAPPLVPRAGFLLHPKIEWVLTSEVEPECWIGDGTRFWLAQQTRGAGRVTVLAAGDAFEHLELIRPGHALLLIGLTAPPEREAVIWLPSRGQQFSLLRLIGGLGPWPLGAIGLWLACWLWSRALRHGPQRPFEPAARRELLEHVAASGRWYWKAQLGDLLLAATREAALARWQRREPGRSEWSGDRLRQELARSTGASRQAIEDAYGLGPRRDAERFTKAIRFWESLRRSG